MYCGLMKLSNLILIKNDAYTDSYGSWSIKNDLPTVAPVLAKTISPDLSIYISGASVVVYGTVFQFTQPF